MCCADRKGELEHGPAPQYLSTVIAELDAKLSPVKLAIQFVDCDGVIEGSSKAYVVVSTESDDQAKLLGAQWHIWEHKVIVKAFHTLQRPEGAPPALSAHTLKKWCSVAGGKKATPAAVKAFLAKVVSYGWLVVRMGGRPFASSIDDSLCPCLCIAVNARQRISPDSRPKGHR